MVELVGVCMHRLPVSNSKQPSAREERGAITCPSFFGLYTHIPPSDNNVTHFPSITTGRWAEARQVSIRSCLEEKSLWLLFVRSVIRGGVAVVVLCEGVGSVGVDGIHTQIRVHAQTTKPFPSALPTFLSFPFPPCLSIKLNLT